MSFHPPIDDVQLLKARGDYIQMRANLHSLRNNYPPETIEQLRLFRGYKDLIHKFGRELTKPHSKIKASTLNELDKRIVRTFVDYLNTRSFGGEA